MVGCEHTISLLFSLCSIHSVVFYKKNFPDFFLIELFYFNLLFFPFSVGLLAFALVCFGDYARVYNMLLYLISVYFQITVYHFMPKSTLRPFHSSCFTYIYFFFYRIDSNVHFLKCIYFN